MRGIFNGGLFLTGLFLSRKSALKLKRTVILISANIVVFMFFRCIPYLIICSYFYDVMMIT